MKEQDDLVWVWLAKADSDLVNARTMLTGPGPYDTACFHCQQAAEKAMKAFLTWHRRPFPFVHDLRQLGGLCEAADPSLHLTVPEVTGLTDYAVKGRYEGDFWPSREDAVEALRVAEGVRNLVLAKMPGLRRPSG